MSNFEDSVRGLIKENRLLHQKLSGLVSDLNHCGVQLKQRADSTSNRAQLLEAEKSRVSEQLSSVQTNLTHQLSDVETKQRVLQSELELKDERLTALTERVHGLEQQLHGTEQELKQTSLEKSVLNSRVEELEKERDRLQAESEALLLSRTELSTQDHSLREQLLSTKSELKNERGTVQSLQVRLKEKAAENQELTAELTVTESKVKKLDLKLKELSEEYLQKLHVSEKAVNETSEMVDELLEKSEHTDALITLIHFIHSECVGTAQSSLTNTPAHSTAAEQTFQIADLKLNQLFDRFKTIQQLSTQVSRIRREVQSCAHSVRSDLRGIKEDITQFPIAMQKRIPDITQCTREWSQQKQRDTEELKSALNQSVRLLSQAELLEKAEIDDLSNLPSVEIQQRVNRLRSNFEQTSENHSESEAQMQRLTLENSKLRQIMDKQKETITELIKSQSVSPLPTQIKPDRKSPKKSKSKPTKVAKVTKSSTKSLSMRDWDKHDLKDWLNEQPSPLDQYGFKFEKLNISGKRFLQLNPVSLGFLDVPPQHHSAFLTVIQRLNQEHGDTSPAKKKSPKKQSPRSKNKPTKRVSNALADKLAAFQT